MTSTGTPPRPWQDAEIHEGVIPQQAIMYPRPVTLECGDCGKTGYWYPDENKIDTGSRWCPDRRRPYHRWTVYSWNGHTPVETGEQS